MNKFRAFMAWYMVTLSFAFIFIITLYEKAHAAKTNDLVLGFLLGTGLAAIIAFYFGSNESPVVPEPPAEKEKEI